MKKLSQTLSAISERNHLAAWKHFGYNSRNHKGLVLHHVDPTLKYNDPERYHEWRPEDLVVMDKREHVRLHRTGHGHHTPGNPYGRKGKNGLGNMDWSPESIYKDKLSQPQRRAVMCVETGKKYISRKEAERETGCYYKSISKCCDGRMETTGGYHWRYIEWEL